MKRLCYQFDNLDIPRPPAEGLETYDPLDERVVVPDGEGNLISSKTDTPDLGDVFGEPFHMPVIDIDLPCRLVESSTPGHFHLYLDAPMPAEVFFDLLDAMVKAGVVEEGYAAVSRTRGEAFVRRPGVKKP